MPIQISRWLAGAIVFFVSLLPAFSAYGATTADDMGTTELSMLAVQLKLSQAQMAEVQKILAMAESQAQLDRSNFKMNAVALFQSALRRREIVDARIVILLTPDQLDTFREFKQRRAGEDELFMWSEGLQLSGEQRASVGQILKKFQMQSGPGRPGQEQNGPGGPGGGGKMGRSEPPSEMGGGRPGEMGGMPEDSEREGAGRMERMTSEIKQHERKKSAEIKKILTDEQKAMVPPLLEFHLNEVLLKAKEQFRKKSDQPAPGSDSER